MNLTHTIGAAIVLSAGTVATAGMPVELAPSQIAGGLSGITNSQLSELIGSEYYDFTHDFQIHGGTEGAAALYEATFMTRVVRSNETGNLHFNYRILNPNNNLNGMISHVEVTGFDGWTTRVEYRSEVNGVGDEGPIDAMRDASGDMLMFDFGSSLEAGEESRFFFAMTDAETFYEDSATATVYLTTGEQISFSVAGANAVPAPGAIGLLSAAGLLSIRRRR